MKNAPHILTADSIKEIFAFTSYIIDKEECKLIQDFKDYKEVYKETLEKFKNVKSEINNLKNNLDLVRK